VPVAMEAAFTAFARQFELAADLLATGITAASGYDPAAAIPYLQSQPRQILLAPGKFHDAHPSVAKRVETIDEAIGKLAPADYDAETGAFAEIKALAGAIP
jgi:predicted Zn-dependent protease